MPEVKSEGMVTVSIRLDASLKNQMESLCKNLGMSMATAYTIFTKKCISEQAIPFKVSVDPIYSEKSVAYIKKAIKELDDGKGIEFNPLE